MLRFFGMNAIFKLQENEFLFMHIINWLPRHQCEFKESQILVVRIHDFILWVFCIWLIVINLLMSNSNLESVNMKKGALSKFPLGGGLILGTWCSNPLRKRHFLISGNVFSKGNPLLCVKTSFDNCSNFSTKYQIENNFGGYE